ncbi:hypothetical protein LOZ51_002794 [Ophidiomyces ophidiicola]|nr:hypothetical protein LOZ55_006527 [Ophidiomyces ophidiicola]KAI1982826.1 hypothetical protein LOZ54_005235 [Ophidiomyces ophidiicola]KAI1998117.1 hypothetical protein LOZ51_002794 [Ophidiomyces ophidiicola]
MVLALPPSVRASAAAYVEKLSPRLHDLILDLRTTAAGLSSALSAHIAHWAPFLQTPPSNDAPFSVILAATVLLGIIIVIIVMAAWRRSSGWRDIYSPTGGFTFWAPEIRDSDFSYMGPEDYQRDPRLFDPRTSTDFYDDDVHAPDVLILNHLDTLYLLQFPAFAISDDILTVGDIRRVAGSVLGASDLKDLSLIYKYTPIPDDSASAKSVGLKQNSTVYAVLESAPSSENALELLRAREEPGQDASPPDMIRTHSRRVGYRHDDDRGPTTGTRLGRTPYRRAEDGPSFSDSRPRQKSSCRHERESRSRMRQRSRQRTPCRHDDNDFLQPPGLRSRRKSPSRTRGDEIESGTRVGRRPRSPFGEGRRPRRSDESTSRVRTRPEWPAPRDDYRRGERTPTSPLDPRNRKKSPPPTTRYSPKDSEPPTSWPRPPTPPRRARSPSPAASPIRLPPEKKPQAPPPAPTPSLPPYVPSTRMPTPPPPAVASQSPNDRLTVLEQYTENTIVALIVLFEERTPQDKRIRDLEYRRLVATCDKMLEDLDRVEPDNAATRTRRKALVKKLQGCIGRVEAVNRRY